MKKETLAALSESTPIKFGLVITLVSPLVLMVLWVGSIQGNAQANYVRNDQRITSTEARVQRNSDFMMEQSKLIIDTNTRLSRIEGKIDLLLDKGKK